jgi:CubicO group peptidase (beta-lactamase class C family)
MPAYSDFVNENPDLRTALDLLDKWAAKHRHESHLPALALGVVYQGELLWGNAYGYANLESQIPATLDSRFRIASITKTFTATAIMQLYDAGQLRLDDPLSKYLSWFNLRYTDAPPITIYHCLTHTSGLPRDATTAHWTENVFQSWEEVIDTTKTRQAMMPPLQDHSYSNLGYTLLGGVIEAVSGMSWSEYIQRHILVPLGMNYTLVTPKGDEGNLAVGYLTPDGDFRRAPVPFIETKGFSPSASIAASVNDLVKYAKFHLSKGQTPILSAYSLREMHRVHWLSADWTWGYGLGTRFWRIGNWTISGHTGGYKGFLTMFSVNREHGLSVIALTNGIDSAPYSVSERAYKLILPEIIKISQQTPVANPAWQDFIGSYVNDWGDFEVIIRNGQLQIVSLSFLDLPPTILEATEEPDCFIIQVVGNPGEIGRFERDASGKVVRYFSRNEYALKKA